MRHVRVLHQVIVIPYVCGTAFDCPPMNLAMLTKDVAVADLQKGLLLSVTEILWFVADYRTHMNHVVLTNICPAGEHGMGQDSGAASNPNLSIDYNIRTNVCLGIDLRPRINESGWMNRHGRAEKKGSGVAPLQTFRPQDRRDRPEYGTIRQPKRQDQSSGSEKNKRGGTGFPARQLVYGMLGMSSYVA